MADAFRKAALCCDLPPPAGPPSRSINKCDKPLGLKHDSLSPLTRISAKKRTAWSLIPSARAGHLLSARRNAGRRQRRRLRSRATIWPPAIQRDGYRRSGRFMATSPDFPSRSGVDIASSTYLRAFVDGDVGNLDGPLPRTHVRHETPQDGIHTNKTPHAGTTVQNNEGNIALYKIPHGTTPCINPANEKSHPNTKNKKEKNTNRKKNPAPTTSTSPFPPSFSLPFPLFPFLLPSPFPSVTMPLKSSWSPS